MRRKKKQSPGLIRVERCKNCSGQGRLRGLFSKDKKCRRCNGTGRL